MTMVVEVSNGRPALASMGRTKPGGWRSSGPDLTVSGTVCTWVVRIMRSWPSSCGWRDGVAGPWPWFSYLDDALLEGLHEVDDLTCLAVLYHHRLTAGDLGLDRSQQGLLVTIAEVAGPLA